MATKLSLEEAAQKLVQELNYPPEKAYQYAKKFDKNNDGQLSASEITNFTREIDETKRTLLPDFKKYDRDGNGYITLREASEVLSSKPYNFPPDKIIQLLKTFDKDGNGKLDIEEFADFYSSARAFNRDISDKFEQLDKDKNGYLTPNEVVGVIKDTFGDERSAQQLVDMFDQNKDGKLDKTEFITMWAALFNKE